MSSSLNSRIVDLVAPGARRDACGRREKTRKIAALPAVSSAERRRLLLALAALPATVLPAVASTNPTAGLRRWGAGDFRRFGFLVYRATLWAGDDPTAPPLALRLDYRRNIAGRAIAQASVDEMRRFGVAETILAAWGERMAALFPDVRPGDHITGFYRPDGAAFSFNERPLGEIRDAVFARNFFGIWLDARTSAPELRAALLRGEG